MRIALPDPIMIYRAQDVPSINPMISRPPIREIGASGRLISGGFLTATEYNSDLQPPQSYSVYDKMRKSDGTVRGLISSVKLPILNVDWRVNPATDDEQDVAIAAWIDDQLMQMQTSLEETLINILLYLDYGSMPLEKVWGLTPDNMVTLTKLAPRLPASILYWNVANNGDLKSITQYAYRPDSIEQIDIPADKLLLFVNEQEASDYRGTSILRPAYKHWYMKDRFYILDAIAKERRAVGVDVGTMMGNDNTEQDERDLQYALMGLHAHEKQFFIEQAERFTYRIEGLGGRPMPLMDSIEHHDRLILRTLLAEFIALGGSGGGSFALSKDKSSFFTMSINSIVKHICGVFNRHLLKQWVDYNWTVTKYPWLSYSKIETRDVQALADAISKLEEAGFLSPTTQDETSIRDALELPTVKRDYEVTGVPINGAQLSAVTTLFQRLGEGTIKSEQVKGILKSTFPFLTPQQIDEMVAGAAT